MQRYITVAQIKDKLESIQQCSWEEVFQLYWQSEEAKWLRMHGEEKTKSHNLFAINTFKSQNWMKGYINIFDLYPISLCLHTEWIIKLSNPPLDSCSNNATNKNTNPTLQDVVSNLNDYPGLIPEKIRSIQNSIIKKELPFEDIFEIIVDHNPPYVYDGNNRLIAVATLSNTIVEKIVCYLGINMSI